MPARPGLGARLMRGLEARSRRRARLLLAFYDHLVFHLALLLLALACATWTVVACLGGALLPPEAGSRLGRRAIGKVFHLLFSTLRLSGRFTFDFSALDSLRDEKSLIIAANHPALWDAVMIVSRLPDVACVMKGDIAGNILLGPGARLARYICNESPLRMIRQSIAELERGGKLLLFPEGTRTSGSGVDTFTGSIGVIASRAGATIQTVLIETDTPFLRKGWPLLRRPRLPMTCRLRLGKRFHVAPGADGTMLCATLETYFRQQTEPASNGATRDDVDGAPRFAAGVCDAGAPGGARNSDRSDEPDRAAGEAANDAGRTYTASNDDHAGATDHFFSDSPR
jgi:1-acyl-sn-glycerol-3-phosphate acyltransferase